MQNRKADSIFRYLLLLCIILSVIIVPRSEAECTGNYDPGTYYDGVDTSSAAALRFDLQNLIDNHTVNSYSAAWDILESADENPGNSADIIDIYKNESFIKDSGSSHDWNREHVWPSTYGFPAESFTPYKDCFNLHACDYVYNSARGNLPFDYDYLPVGDEFVTDYNNGVGGTGETNKRDDGYWEPWDFRKGDVANSYEPDLQLTNNIALIQGGDPYMGMLETLVQWHLDDPVDDCERRRNHIVWQNQGNRNPFIDNPDWVCIIWENELPCVSAGTPTPSPTPGGTGTGEPWINEIHYDNAGTDVNEGIELAGPAGFNLSGWKLIAYNGSTGNMYDTQNLTGIFPDMQECLGVIWFPFPNLQNGGPDGIALVNSLDETIQFLSYEGVFTALDGPASAMTSEDIGVSESSSTADNFSLQSGGIGNCSTDFTWQSAMANTRDQINTNQTFAGGCITPTPGISPTPTQLASIPSTGKSGIWILLVLLSFILIPLNRMK